MRAGPARAASTAPSASSLRPGVALQVEEEAATQLWDYATRGWARKAWNKLIGWAMRSRLKPMKAAAKTVREHLWGILNAVRHKASNAGAESVNAKIPRRLRWPRNSTFHQTGEGHRPARYAEVAP